MDLKVLWTISNSMGTVSDLKMLKTIKDFNIDVITTDIADKDSAGSIVSGKRYLVPNGCDPGYIDKIIDICKNERITTIVPQYGDELVPLSKNIKLFNEFGVKILVTEDTEKLEIANNKNSLYDYLKNRWFIPSYEFVSTVDDVERAVYKMGYPNVPVCVKVANGEGGMGVRIVTENVNIFDEQLGSPKTSLKVFKQQMKELSMIPQFIVMEYLPGIEYSVDCICMGGETYVCIPRRREDTSLGVATVSIVERNEELINISKEIISKLNLSYNINIQFKYTDKGEPKLIEINPRVSGSLIANYGAGVNMLELSLKLAYGIPLDDINVKWGTKMLRYWEQVFTT